MTKPQYSLPRKLDVYFRALAKKYSVDGQSLLQEILVNATVEIEEGEAYDNWNGGMYGHGVNLKVPEDLYMAVLDEKGEIEKTLTEKLNHLNTQENEWITRISLDMVEDDDEDWRSSSGVYRRPHIPVSLPPESLDRIWQPGLVRVFLSHKSDVKVEAARLKAALRDYGLYAFVAHEDIEPDEAWQREIERALFSMDALVALLTPGFHQSDWTHQEVGVAIGRGVPAVSVRLGVDPRGLMGKKQALNGCSLDAPTRAAGKIFRVLYNRLPDRSKLADAVVSSYSEANTFAQSGSIVMEALSVFETMTPSQIQAIQQAYRNNNQNYGSFKGTNNLLRLLKKWTGQEWKVEDNDLVNVSAITDIPF